MVALSPKTPAVRLCDLVSRLVEEVDVIDLLDSATCKARLMLDQIFQMRFRTDFVIAVNGLVSGPVSA